MQTVTRYKPNAFFFPFDSAFKQGHEMSDMAQKTKRLIIGYFQSNQPIEVYSNGCMDDLFRFRMAALKWAVTEQIDLEQSSNNIIKDLSAWKNHPYLAGLYETVAFAIRTNMRVLKIFSANNRQGVVLSSPQNVPQVSYTEYISIMSMSLPDDALALIMDFMEASLHLEFGLIAASLIHSENIAVSKDQVYILSEFLANSAQEFGAILNEIMPAPKKDRILIETPLSEDIISENKMLAELGLDEFAQNF